MIGHTNDKIVSLHGPCPSCVSSDAYCEWEDGHGHCFSCGYHKNKDQLVIDVNSFTYEFLPHRGLSKESLRKYDIQTKVDLDGKPVSVGFIYPDKAVKVRQLDEKTFVWTKDGK